MTDKTLIGVLIVLYDTQSVVEKLVNSLQRQTFHSFIVYAIDCQTASGELTYFKSIYPSVKSVQSRGNIGFAKANNLLAQKAIEDGCKYLFVVNPDMELAANTLEVLYKLLEKDETVGACSTTLLFGGKRKEQKIIQLLGANANFNTQSKHFLFSNKKFNDVKLPSVLTVDFINTGSLFVRSELVKKIGLFEEDYFMYNDEIDIANRIRKAGYKIAVTSQSHIWHHHDYGKMNISSHRLMYYYMMRNRYLYFKKFNLYFNLIFDCLIQLISFPLKIKWFYKLGSVSITKYYYFGILKGLLGEKGKTTINFE